MANEPVTPERVIERLEELSLHLDPDIAYAYESLFTKVEGWGADRYIKGKCKLIGQIEPRLKRILDAEEQVLYVGKGVQQKFAEQYFMGWLLANLINQTVFVLTNLRLLMIHSNTKGQPRHTQWMIYYNQIDRFKISMLSGQVKLRLRDGQKLVFSGFQKLDRKQMPRLFEQAVEDYRALDFNPEVSQSRENLCSHCYEVVPKGQHTCEKCGAEFWRPGQLALRSLVLPSWGDFLMGHTSAAILELGGYALSWLVFLAIIAGSATEGAGALITAVVIVAVLVVAEHGIDAALTYFIAKKGLHPKQAPAG